MQRMTWTEFKEIVDAELDAQGISHDTEIWYIDISFPDKDDEMVIWNKENVGIAI